MLKTLKRKTLFVTDRKICYVRYWDNDGELWVFAGRPQDKVEVMREVGRTACDPDLSFCWFDAANVNAVIRERWPDSYETHENCQCHACEQRRSRDSEMIELAKPKARKPKWDFIVVVFFTMLIWRAKVRQWKTRIYGGGKRRNAGGWWWKAAG